MIIKYQNKNANEDDEDDDNNNQISERECE